MERTFVIIKPDAISRGLVGEVISALERANLKLVTAKMVKPTAGMIRAHYPDTEDWFANIGTKTYEGYALTGKNVKEAFGTDDKVAIGKQVKQWLIDYLTSGDVIAMVWEGHMVVRNVRRLCGNTLPIFADPGSIRGRFGYDNPDIANEEKRAVQNLIHASSDVNEAEKEISLWFPELR